jgi:hypothetical protein
MTDKEYFQAIYAVIEDPKHWTQGVCFRDAKGEPCRMPEKDGSFCLCGVTALLGQGTGV